ncbi:MAG TPA: efflux RND transporter permease subunit [Armatimonadota bacterium]|nr:efflux RND transporter permease subunit [Armatimonadota bacterium]
MWLTNLAIRRPIVILMVFAALIVLGLKSRSGMPLDFFPKVDIPYVVITTVYPGAGPEEIETLVSKPLEDAVGSVSGMKNIMSYSQEGISRVAIEFELGTNLDTAMADVRAKVDAVRMSLPQDAETPAVNKIDIGALPVLWLGMSSKRPAREMRDLADDVIKVRLGKLKGVAAVTVTGGDVREIQVNVDKHRLEAHGLSISQISQALTLGNLNLPSGHITEGSREYAVRAVGEFGSVDEIRDLRVHIPGGDDGARVLAIRDIAEVKDTTAEREETTRLQKEDSIGLLILKQSDANTVQVVDAVKKELAAMKDILPPDVKIAVAMDQSDRVKEALADVNVSLWLGAFLAVLIVFLFLHSIRGTFIVAIAIPTSIVATFTPIYFADFTMNMMVMLGLALAVGILVDDSIVVLENIYRHLAKGEEPAEAAFNGRAEIGLAAITITMVDVVVFVPIAFMGGMVGRIFREFGITVATATMFSLLVSFTLTPMLASRWYRKGEAVEAASGFFAKFDRFYHALDVRYRRVLAWALAHRRLVVSMGFGVLFAILFGMMGRGMIALAVQRPWLAVGLTFGFSLLIMLFFIGLRRAIAWAASNRLAAAAAVVGLFLVIVVAVMGYTAFAQVPAGPWLSAIVKLGLLLVLIFGVTRYRRIAVWARAHESLAAVAGFALLLIIVPMVMPVLGFEFFPRTDQNAVGVTVEMPVGSSLQATDRVVRQVEDVFATIPEVESIFASVGSTQAIMGASQSGANYGQVNGGLREKESVLDRFLRPFFRRHPKRIRSDQQIAQEVRRKIASIPGGRIIVQIQSGMGHGGSPIDIELTGGDMEELTTVADRIKAVVARAEGVINPDVTWKVGKPELEAGVDRVRAAEMGFSVGQIASALRTSVEGSTDTHFRDNGKEYDIRVRLNEFDRYSVSDVGHTVIGSIDGKPVFLQDLARITQATGPTKIERKNRQRKVSVTADLAPGYHLGNVQRVLSRGLKDMPLGNVNLHWGGETQEMRENMAYLVSALLLSVALVYMLMAALFESLVSPLIIMFSLPMALIGAILALATSGETLSIVTMIGMIMLMGLVTKNAILLVDYTNTLRSRGVERNAAILEAGPTRLRPILMTTFAMIFGMLPTALKLGRGSEMRAPMAIAVIGGLIVSALLTLVVIPTLYTIFDDLMVKYQARKQALLERVVSK